jgi:bacteriorhodopsin
MSVGELLLRVGIYLPVLYLIAVVVMSQRYTTARDTLKAAGPRTVRWAIWSVGLVAVMEVLAILFVNR